MSRALGQHTQSEKEPRQNPCPPAGPSFLPRDQPENESDREKRDVKSLDLGHAPFLDQSEIDQPGERRHQRPAIAENAAATDDKEQGGDECGDGGRQAGGPLITHACDLEDPGDDPAHKRRFFQVRLAADMRNKKVATVEHLDRRYNAPPFFAAELRRPEKRQVKSRPNHKNEKRIPGDARHDRVDRGRNLPLRNAQRGEGYRSRPCRSNPSPSLTPSGQDLKLRA